MTQNIETKRQYVALATRVKQAEELAKASPGGKLPRFTRLMKIDEALAQALHRNPAAFAHIPREANVNLKVSEHVKTAEEVAAKFAGFLPAYSDLLKTHRRLATVVRDHPEEFAHIPRARTIKQIERMGLYVSEAERLAAENGGVLELTAAFQREHNALVLHIRRHPEKFDHIPRKRRTTTLKDGSI